MPKRDKVIVTHHYTIRCGSMKGWIFRLKCQMQIIIILRLVTHTHTVWTMSLPYLINKLLLRHDPRSIFFQFSSFVHAYMYVCIIFEIDSRQFPLRPTCTLRTQNIRCTLAKEVYI